MNPTRVGFLALLLGCTFGFDAHAQAFLKRLEDKVKQTAENKAVNQTGDATNKSIDEAENAAKNALKKKPKEDDEKPSSSSGQQAASAQPSSNQPSSASSSGGKEANTKAPVFTKAYTTYDFVPGEKIIFEDDLQHDPDGEFPAHWKLEQGQAIVNKLGDAYALLITDGNYGRVAPRMTKENYMPKDFTIEFDYYQKDGAYDPMLFFKYASGNDKEIRFGYQPTMNNFDKSLSGTYGGARENYRNTWHHAAIIKKGNTMKVYSDQYRVLVNPDCNCDGMSGVEWGAYASIDNPIIIKGVRIAEGGGMTMVGPKFTDAKLVTHGIKFDVDKASLRPESMGTLNQIKKLLDANPDIKFRVDGHTDNSGTPAHNLALSKQRAEAVRDQLVNMGIVADRLTTKGLGDTVPLSANATQEGMANNRRVEFVRQ